MTTNKINDAIEERIHKLGILRIEYLAASLHGTNKELKNISDKMTLAQKNFMHEIATIAIQQGREEEREECARLCSLRRIGMLCASCDGARCEHNMACKATRIYQSAIRARGQGNEKTV